MNPKIYAGTVLFEKNRWEDGPDNNPSFPVSAWLDRLQQAGFDGVELWEKHATMCDEAELSAMLSSEFPIRIFNSYISLTDDDPAKASRTKAAELTAQFGAWGVKFNVGRDGDCRDEYMRNLADWRTQFASDVTLLCECHPGTIIEEPAAAKAFFDEIGIDGFGVIVHAFGRPDTLAEWCDLFGPAVRHVHAAVQNDKKKFTYLNHDSASAEKAVDILRRAGFDGTYTVEFTDGVAAPDETPEMLLANASGDLQYLRGLLA